MRKGSRMLKKLILCLVCFSSAQAEYLFFNKKHNGFTPLTTEEHNALYPLITTYLFPMNTNPTIGILATLSSDERQQMYTNEIGFLQNKLSNDIGVVFIPTTLYELLTIYLWFQLKLLIPENYHGSTVHTSPFGIPRITKRWQQMPPMLTPAAHDNTVNNALLAMLNLWLTNYSYTTSKTSEVASFALYHHINMLPPLQKMHLLINNEIINYCQQHAVALTDLTPEKTKAMVHHFSDLKTFFANAHGNMQYVFTGSTPEWYLCSPGIIEEELLILLIEKEYQAHKQGDFLLYRGTDQLKGRNNRMDSTFTFRKGSVRPNSVSYGNSLFAALFGDDAIVDGGATAYSYMVKKELAYVVSINKHAYANGPVNELFHIPPLSTVAGFVGHGELFHARSRAVLETSDDILCGVLCINGKKKSKAPSFLYQLNKDKIEHEDQFATYLAQHATIVKNKTGTDGEALIKALQKAFTFTDISDTGDNYYDLK